MYAVSKQFSIVRKQVVHTYMRWARVKRTFFENILELIMGEKNACEQNCVWLKNREYFFYF